MDQIEYIRDNCEGTKSATVVTVAFEIIGISLTDLDVDAQNALKTELAQGIASETGVGLDMITIKLEKGSRRLAEVGETGASWRMDPRKLSQGSIKVKADIQWDNAATVESKAKAVETTEIVKNSPTLKKVVEGKGGSMEAVSSSPLSVTVTDIANHGAPPKQAGTASGASDNGLALSAVLVMMAAWWSSKY